MSRVSPRRVTRCSTSTDGTLRLKDSMAHQRFVFLRALNVTVHLNAPCDCLDSELHTYDCSRSTIKAVYFPMRWKMSCAASRMVQHCCCFRPGTSISAPMIHSKH